MDEYIAKPVRIADFNDMIKRWVTLDKM